MKNKKGFTLVELLVVIAIIALLIGLLLPALAKARQNAQSLKDKTQISQVHKATLSYAEENKGNLPVPGLINRVGTQLGQGVEDTAQNHTAPLYSVMLAQNLFNAELLIGTTEVNPAIRADQDYNFAAYKPVSDTYWDTAFKGDPSVASTGECNVSYSHSALCGMRKKMEWKLTQRSGFAVFGTRGTGGGSGGFGGGTTGPEYERSPTLQLHGPKQQWMGHICFNDNHVETLTDYYTSLCTFNAGNVIKRDNIYGAEYAGGQNSGDSYLGMFTNNTNNGTASQQVFDPLNP